MQIDVWLDLGPLYCTKQCRTTARLFAYYLSLTRIPYCAWKICSEFRIIVLISICFGALCRFLSLDSILYWNIYNTIQINNKTMDRKTRCILTCTHSARWYKSKLWKNTLYMIKIVRVHCWVNISNTCPLIIIWNNVRDTQFRDTHMYVSTKVNYLSLVYSTETKFVAVFDRIINGASLEFSL